MKKNNLLCLIILSGSVFMSVNSMAKLEQMFGYDKKSPATQTERLDTEGFWNEAVVLFNKAGYGPNTEFGKHAASNLHRVQTMRGIKRGVRPTAAKAKAAKRGVAPKTEKQLIAQGREQERLAEKKALSKKRHDAYEAKKERAVEPKKAAKKKVARKKKPVTAKEVAS